MSFETGYKGHLITMTEDGEFECKALQMRAASVAALKKKIDKPADVERILHPLRLMYAEYGGFRRMVPVILIRKSKNEQHRFRGEERVWVCRVGSGTNFKVNVRSLYPDVEGAYAQLEELLKQHRDAAEELRRKQNEEFIKTQQELGAMPFNMTTLVAAAADAAGDKETE